MTFQLPALNFAFVHTFPYSIMINHNAIVLMLLVKLSYPLICPNRTFYLSIFQRMHLTFDTALLCFSDSRTQSANPI